MRKQHDYGKRNDGTFAYPVTFSDVRKDTISALLFDDSEMEATPDTWLTQTTLLIERIRECLGDANSSVVSIEPTNDPLYSLAFVVEYDKAVEIQHKIDAYIHALSKTLFATTPPK